MATLYVNSITGADANNGSTWALAKKTLAGASSAATALDTIYCHGLFNEAVPVAKALSWRGFGYCQFNGSNVINGPIVIDKTSFYSLTLANYLNGCVRPQSAATIYCNNVIFRDAAVGFAVGYLSPNVYLDDCLFNNLSTAAVQGIGSTINATLRNCVFSGNAISIDDGGNAGSVTAIGCAFRDLIMWKGAATFINTLSKWNVYDFSAGKCVVGGVDKTTLASWIAAITAPADTNSIDRVWSADVGDYANGVLRSNPAGYLLTAGAGSAPIGLTLPGVTISNNKNSSLWTGGVFSNTELDGSGYLVLSAGQTVGTYKTDVIDFGAAINAKAVEIALAGEAAALPYLDYDTADSPGYFNVRVRGSNTLFAKADASPSWVIVPRRAEIGAYMSNALRYWQIELTLRA